MYKLYIIDMYLLYTCKQTLKVQNVQYGMNRIELKQILTQYFKENTVNSLLNGRRHPSFKRMKILKHSHNIPYDAWEDIKKYLSQS